MFNKKLDNSRSQKSYSSKKIIGLCLIATALTVNVFKSDPTDSWTLRSAPQRNMATLEDDKTKISTESHDDVVLLDSDSKEVKRIFVNYVFSGGAERSDSQDNLSFFLREGVTAPLDDSLIIDYGITSNGVCTVEECMKPETFLHANENDIFPLVRVLHRENEGFDFGGHTAMLEELDAEGVTQNYDAFIFLNDGVVGPFTPSYFPSSWHWSKAFFEKFTDESDIRGEIGLVGTSIVCLPEEDLGGLGPKVEGFAFAISRHALEIVRAHGTSFRQHKNKVEAILFGEYNLSKILFENDINIDCLLNAYKGKDWRKETQCNEQQHPSRKNTYFGTSINPLEVVFHKPNWNGMDPVNKDIVMAYKKFSDNQRGLKMDQTSPTEPVNEDLVKAYKSFFDYQRGLAMDQTSPNRAVGDQ